MVICSLFVIQNDVLNTYDNGSSMPVTVSMPILMHMSDCRVDGMLFPEYIKIMNFTTSTYVNVMHVYYTYTLYGFYVNPYGERYVCVCARVLIINWDHRIVRK